jgi:hypothetical protein
MKRACKLFWGITSSACIFLAHSQAVISPPNVAILILSSSSPMNFQTGSDWVIQCHIIREQGVVVAGPAPQTLIDPVQPNDLRRAALGILREWWSPQIHDPSRLHSSEYQAYAILTMCRALYTLQYGIVVSKPVAARWAQQALGERWAALIERALAWSHNTQLVDLNETLDFIRYTLERGQQFEIPTEEV